MRTSEFASLIQELEESARNDPSGYRRWVIFYALIGYGFLVGMIFLLPLVIYGSTILLLEVIAHSARITPEFLVAYGGGCLTLLGITYDLIISLWVTLPYPQGRELTAEEAPALFQALAEIRATFQIAPIDHVLLDLNMNAAVYQYPRLGIFGWYKNYLVIGLPLLLALTKDQFRAVLTHELGHVSENHGRFGAWAFRLRSSWARLLESLHSKNLQGQGVGYLMTNFCEWFAPIFMAYTFVLGRRNELVSDQYAAKVGDTAFIEALIAVNLKARYLSAEFWPSVMRRSFLEKEPPTDVFVEMAMGLRDNPSDVAGQAWLMEAAEIPTDLVDTHPSLNDRLATMGMDFQHGALLKKERVSPTWLLPPGTRTAAQEMLGDSFTGLLAEANQQWRKEVRITWMGNHSQGCEKRSELIALQEKAGSGTITRAERIALIRRTIDFHGAGKGLPMLQAYLREFPDCPEGNFLNGATLLQNRDSSGIGFLEKARTSDPFLTTQALGAIHDYWQALGDKAQAEALRREITAFTNLWEAAQHERQEVRLAESFLPSQISPDVRERIRTLLRTRPEIIEAYLARKKVEVLPELPCYILGIVIDRSRIQRYLRPDEELEENAILLNSLYYSLNFLHSFLIVPLHGEMATLIFTLTKAEGSRLL